IVSAVTEAAAVGATQIKLDPTKITGIVVNYTGLSNQGSMGAYPLITSLNTVTGIANLSAPLDVALSVGTLNLMKIKYRPFSPPTFADGTSNPVSLETLDGWGIYVRSVCNFVTSVLGAGNFDVECWNEMTFGASFLNINNYYNPDLAFTGDYGYTS